MAAKYFLSGERIAWIRFEEDSWVMDLEKLKEHFRELHKYEWLKGSVSVMPVRGKVPTVEKDIIIDIYLTPKTVEEGRMPVYNIPVEISQSLKNFREDHPDPTKVAFIMMRFGTTKAHHAITEAIRAGFHAAGITAVRADDRQYHDQLFPNILTYLYGSSIGVVVFERLEAEDFNPNASLELGYMLAMSKPVCLLKDKTLRTLQTDLVGHLYKAFDPQDPGSSIPPLITRWLKDQRSR